ncbi:MAG: hypothetical protein II796_00365 [Oscillospiraceae bacterium]|nr:hypothetical protein [Oscillospiraceae bacterium]
MVDFLPVLLGTDLNVYGMARAFYEEYDIKSLAIGELQLMPTKNSAIVNTRIIENFSQADVFLAGLKKIAAEFKSKFSKLLLIACGDTYVKLVINNKKSLQQDFVVPYIDAEIFERLAEKEAFYSTCKEYGLDFPKTFIISKQNKDSIDLPFLFPVALKPSNSMKWLNCSFSGKKKAFIVKDRKEFDAIINKVYNSSYTNNMIVQEFIPGDDTNMRVLNCYVGKDNKVKLMCLGQPLLEDKAPGTVGNYLAIVNSYNEEICLKIKDFLEKLNYTGFANFDMKYDARDGKFKLFEINLRQGRSSYFVTGSGYNLAKYVVEDWILDHDLDFCIADYEHLWLGFPKHLLFKCLSEEHIEYVKSLIKQKKVCTTLFYKKDRNIKKFLNDIRFFATYYRTFKKYFRTNGRKYK